MWVIYNMIEKIKSLYHRYKGHTQGAYKARFWQPFSAEKIQCQLCPRECVMGVGQRGFCFVRKNEGGELVLT